MKVKIFHDYEDVEGLEETINEFTEIYHVTDVKFSTAIGSFEGNPYATVSAMVIYEE